MNIAPTCMPVEAEAEGRTSGTQKTSVVEANATDWEKAQIQQHLHNHREQRARVIPYEVSEEDDLTEECKKLGIRTYADKETVEEAITASLISGFEKDSQTNSQFPIQAMTRAYIVRIVSPNINGFDQLEWYLERNAEIAELYDFDPDNIPDRTTFSTQWYERYDRSYRHYIRWEAAKFAAKMKYYDIEIDDSADQLLNAFLPDEETHGPDIPEEHRIENESRDRVFNEFQDLFAELLDYGRGHNKQIPAEQLTEQATFTSRRNESVLGGRDVYVAEHKVTKQNYMSAQTLTKPIRNYSRKLAELNYAKNNAILPNKECYDWSVNPEDRDFGDGERWHDRTEEGIGKQVKMLQERGMLDRPVDICIDGTAREYNNRNDTDVEEPDGVLHRYPKYETGYAWEDITVTAIYRGRAIVLASISKVKSDNQFQCVRYLIDRARDLVPVNNVYADSEFGTQKICSYINHCGLDYITKKRKTSSVKTFMAKAEGRADWTDYDIEGGDHTKHKTTLVTLENISKSVTKKGEKRDTGPEDGREQATLPGVETEEDDEDDDEIKLAAFITSLDIESRGLGPNKAGPRRDHHTAFGVGELYRKRWSIETAFRDIKRNFKAKPRSRCLGIRRFFFMLCLLLYNCWVVLNLIVADEVDHRNDDEIIWRKKIFIIDLHNEVFPDIEFG